jgi:hypothetical protein
MITKNRNYLAGLLMLGSVVFGSQKMLDAAQASLGSFLDDPKEQAIQLYSEFEKQVKIGIKKRERDPEKAGLLSLLNAGSGTEYLNYYLGNSQDTTLESAEKSRELMADIYQEAMKNSLENFQFYEEVRTNIKNRLSFGRKSNISKTSANPSKLSNHRNHILGAQDLETSLRPSLSHGQLNAEATFKLKDFELLGTEFNEARLGVDRYGLKAILRKTLSEGIYAGLSLERDFQDSETEIGLGLSKSIKDGNWSLGVGYHTGKEGDGISVGLNLIKYLR